MKLFFNCKKIRFFVASMMIVGSVGVSSCGKGGDYPFEKPEDAITCYQKFHTKLKTIKNSNTTDFSNLLYQWREINDTVRNFLLRDSVMDKDVSISTKYLTMRDSVKTQMIRLAESWRYSYADVMKIKEQTTPFTEDADLQAAVQENKPFFSSLDKIQLGKTEKNRVLRHYKTFLEETKRNGINNKEELLSFIKQEDYCFRAFLTHLYEMSDDSLTEITKLSEEICKDVFRAASKGKINARDAVVVMSMRTSRRLLQNSLKCIEDINKLPMKDAAQLNAYLLMIIQPFISIDKLTVATLTDTDKKNLQTIVSELPKSKNIADGFDTDLNELNFQLPQQILKIYILSF